jgi:putative beta-lysine N-acetyltransferase
MHYKIINKSNKKFKTKILLDFKNKRLKLLNYRACDYYSMDNYLVKTAQENNLEKIIIISKEFNVNSFIKTGYLQEAVDPYFYKGRSGHYLAKFLSKQRSTVTDKIEKDKIISTASKKGKYEDRLLDKNFTVEKASKKDVPDLIELYGTIFKSYPTPITDSSYLEKAVANNVFLTARNNSGKIIASISADIDMDNLNAEITDCATLPECRGKKIMYQLVNYIEKEMQKFRLKSLYTIARAVSPGINTVFKRNGYTYSGRLIKNCDISGSFEDMNLWTKKI